MFSDVFRQYLIGQNNVGQNFRHLQNFCHICGTKNFVHFQNLKPFSKFEISSKKTQFIYFFRNSPFLYHKNNNNNNNKTCSTFQQLCSTRSHCPQSTMAFFLRSAWSPYYSLPRHPNHRNREFAVTFSFSLVSSVHYPHPALFLFRLLFRFELLFHRRF